MRRQKKMLLICLQEKLSEKEILLCIQLNINESVSLKWSSDKKSPEESWNSGGAVRKHRKLHWKHVHSKSCNTAQISHLVCNLWYTYVQLMSSCCNDTCKLDWCHHAVTGWHLPFSLPFAYVGGLFLSMLLKLWLLLFKLEAPWALLLLPAVGTLEGPGSLK